MSASPSLALAPGSQVQHGWHGSRIVLLLGLALIVLLTVAMLWVARLDYRGNVVAEIRSQVLMARVLADHATRTVDTASMALAATADRLQSHPHRTTAELTPLLREAQAALPFVRSIVLLDNSGVLLASTASGDPLGRKIDLAALGLLPAAGQERLGTFMPGRHVGDLVAQTQPPAGVGFIPLLRRVRLGHDSASLIALLNPDAIANHQTMALVGTHFSAVLTDYSGQVLAATADAGATPGQSIAVHEVFRTHLASLEHTSYVGRGLGAEPKVVAYRASRTRPLVALVEQPEKELRSAWWHNVREFAGVFFATVLLLGGMTAIAWRGMRLRERTRSELDRSQAQVALRERELSVTVKSVQELIFRTDASGAITFVNARWAAVGDGTAADAIGRSLADVAVPEQRADIEALFERASGKGARHAQIAFRTPGPKARLFDVAVVPLTEGGTIVGFAGSAADVTERVTAQQKLRTQLAVTELMLETSPLPLSLRNAHGCFLSVNQAWENFTGLRREDVIGRAAMIPAFDEGRPVHHAHDRDLLAQGGGRVRYEATLRHADGSRRDTVIQKALVPGADGPAGILTVVMDVSEFRAAERATREARDAAEEASRAKSEFIANISHELRTPLQSILGFSELGLTRGSAQPKLAGMFQDIHSSGMRMLALVNDLLDVSKIESAVGTLHLERTDLRPLVREVVRELDPLLAGRGLSLDQQLSEAPLIAKVDPLRFQQVVRNVLANAVRFSPLKGRIEVSAAATSTGEIHLQIRDQGPGIPPDEIESIFDAFVQSSKTKDGSGGTGLGLTISRKILEVMGGRIDAQNLPRGGAAFNIHVPLKTSLETEPMPL